MLAGDDKLTRVRIILGITPLEKMMRLLTSAGDRAEKALGAQIGPDLARRYRELHHGFDNRSRSSYGCPGEGE